MKLFFEAIAKFLLGFMIVAAMLFLSAGSLLYINGWIFILLLFVPMLILGAILFIKSPLLLKKRLDSREKEKTQKGVVAFSGLLFVIGFIVAGLDFRFGLSVVPTWAVVIASVIFLISYALYAEVMRENAYLSRKIEVQAGQSVVSTGLYGIVRHPMYAATIWLFLSIPIVLGSFWALICFLPYVFIIAVRIIDEEKLLSKELCGYEEYKKKVRYRLIPFVW
ncbi:MAG: isoprenylcysteine carboxylmethyltransferase family protein [Clostridia bacterium]|nr:isoprenylcysteine carboxylmethyltransferase family protein [Clostridia bacterium]